ncbi:MAG: LPS export ABC transporter permease LptF [Deltaproteobacteria bacterium]|nr:LPS export ABC transporter permease LptF [Deltaproteobacteria bacterium]
MKRTLSLYVVSEIIPPFLLGLMAFTFILLTARILKLVELLVTRGVSPIEIGKLFAFILPTFLEMTVPMALLLGILVGLAGLSNDHEILALKASGISPYQVFWPIGMLALFISLLTLLLTTSVRPASNRALKQQLFNIAKSHVATALKENVFNNDFPKVLIYVEEVIPPGNTSQGVLIVDRRDPNRETVIFGKVALFLSDEQTATLGLKLFDGVIHEKEKGQSVFSQTHFNVYNFNVDLEETFNLMDKREQDPSEMSVKQLGEAIRSKQAQGLNPVSEIMDLHERFAFPFAPLVFSLLGVALVLMPAPSRQGRFWGLVSCLFWLLLYYALLTTGKALGERELIAPVLALWLPNLLVGLVAVHFFIKALTESPPLFEGGIQNATISFLRNLIPKQKGAS